MGRALAPGLSDAIGAVDRVTGTATLTQSDWGIKPYSALFGTLKVLDDITVEVDAQLPEPTAGD